MHFQTSFPFSESADGQLRWNESLRRASTTARFILRLIMNIQRKRKEKGKRKKLSSHVVPVDLHFSFWQTKRKYKLKCKFWAGWRLFSSTNCWWITPWSSKQQTWELKINWKSNSRSCRANRLNGLKKKIWRTNFFFFTHLSFFLTWTSRTITRELFVPLFTASCTLIRWPLWHHGGIVSWHVCWTVSFRQISM